MALRLTERLTEKTEEGRFLHEMKADFELAPAASRAVLQTRPSLPSDLRRVS